MGCGSSSLKGDAPTGIGGSEEPAPRPLKKVVTNFSTVNYDTNAPKRRHTEYAPHETERQPSAISEAVEHAKNGLEPNDPGPTQEGEELKPYHTIEGDEPMSPSEAPPTTNGIADNSDPTSETAKKAFATDNDPANPSNQHLNGGSAAAGSAIGEQGDDGQKKQSTWLGKKYKQYADARDGRNSEVSEEDLQKYTGKSKQEVKELVESGDGVGGGQSNSMRDTPGPGSRASGAVMYSGMGAGG